MYCKHCGRELDYDVAFCPYCGTRQNTAGSERKDPDETQASAFSESSYSSSGISDSGTKEQLSGAAAPSAPVSPSKKKILGITIPVASVAVLLILCVILIQSVGSSSSGERSQIINPPKLSEANITAANQVIDIVDKYLDSSTLENLFYGSETATEDLMNVKNSMVEEQNAVLERIRQKITDDIDQIIEELNLNEKSLSNAARILEGGGTADKEKVQKYRDHIQQLVEEYS